MFKYGMDCMNFLGSWACLDWKIRLGSAIGVLLLAGLLAIGERSRNTAESYKAPIVRQPDQPPPPHDYRAALLVGGFGVVLLMFSGRSKAEKAGYHDF